MGLLRACADALVIGSGTHGRLAAIGLDAGAGATRRPQRRSPSCAQRLGRAAASPRSSCSPAAAASTRPPGVRRRRARPHDRRRRRAARRDGSPEARDRLARRRARSRGRASQRCATRGHRLILSEGGPHAIAPFLAAGLVDELFLTVSPLLAGRLDGDDAARARRGRRPVPGRAARAPPARRPPRRRPPLPALRARRCEDRLSRLRPARRIRRGRPWASTAEQRCR